MEQKSLTDEEVFDFLKNINELNWLIKLLALSGISVIRIIEDLIDLLIEKKIILLTDLPEAAREKIRERRIVRQGISKENFMVEDII